LYRHLFLAHNSFLRDVFPVFLLRNSDNDSMLKTVFWTASVTDYNIRGNVLPTALSVPIIMHITYPYRQLN